MCEIVTSNDQSMKTVSGELTKITTPSISQWHKRNIRFVATLNLIGRMLQPKNPKLGVSQAGHSHSE